MAAKLSGVYPELACFQDAPAPYLRASIVPGPTRALRTSTTPTYGHHDAMFMEAA